MNKQEILNKAIKNNANWCDLICTSHKIPGVFNQLFWYNTKQTPNYYPNLITIEKITDVTSIDLKNIINQLKTKAKTFSIKDSYFQMEPSTLGLKKLFSAEWIYLQSNLRLKTPYGQKVSWQQIKSPRDLKKWEIAWSKNSSGKSSVFLPSILKNDKVFVFSASKNDKIVSGAIVFNDEGVCSLTNFFAPEANTEEYWKSLVFFIKARMPKLPLVGYEREFALEIALSSGFKSLGKLQVLENS